MRQEKLLWRVRAGSGNVRFRDMVLLAEAHGFRLSRVKGSHHIFTHPEIPDIINLQNAGGKAKPYQVRQFLVLVDEYGLELRKEGRRRS